MTTSPCPLCWCPHTTARPCHAKARRATWAAASTDEQRSADNAEGIAIDRFLRLRRAG